ncbi:MAG: bifunctional (p)ppGpp synthetase/guanosine-3',5'-bis(diphosphate) 3'-pyrophosphohydrolase [Pseudomonadota bacterium]
MTVPTALAESSFSSGGIDFSPLMRRLDYLAQEKQTLVLKACRFAEQAHDGQYRRSGEAYIYHPLAVASILADMHLDHQSIIAAVLHDVIEDTSVTKTHIRKEFGRPVAELVDGVSKISAIQFESRAVAQAENFRKMVLAMSRDIRVILVKLADRLHNMRTLGVLPRAKRQRIAAETLEIYAPIANRLGIENFRTEFENLGFSILHPFRYERLKRAIDQSVGHQKSIFSEIELTLRKRLSVLGSPVRIISREKHVYSVYRKMKEQRKPFRQIMDLIGFRIVVSDLDSCYRVLGLAHNLFKPVPGRFKDYIAIPKTNGYQALHTTLKGQTGKPLEIQIRTEEMDALAENGIAAHWSYKIGGIISGGTAHRRAQDWLSSLLEIQEQAGNSLEFIEHVKVDLFPHETYVFTPKGNILELPAGATPVDFAYMVHTDIGHSCIAARVDHRLVPLSFPLQSGQTVEIITSSVPAPNPAWLTFTVTSKAKSSIRHFLKNQKQSESVSLGKRLLARSLSAYELTIDQISKEMWEKLFILVQCENQDHLFQEIGLGNRMAPIIAFQLIPQDRHQDDLGRLATPLTIRGTEGMVVHYAKCCYPIPGDQILGHLSAGKGVIIHTSHCLVAQGEVQDEAILSLPVDWSTQASCDFMASIVLQMENKRGALAQIATIIAQCESNIENIRMDDIDPTMTRVTIDLAVKDRIHLARIMKRLRTAGVVHKMVRQKG